MEVIKEEVYSYLKMMTGAEINDDTRIFNDLSMDGLDAEQMMIQISEKYNVDMSGYDPAMYHLSDAEITNILLHIWRTISGTTKKHLSFTALHLYKVTEAGKWFPPANKY